MQHQLCVLLYSKYSPQSQKLVTALQGAPVDLGAAMGLTLVCIDNEDIRAKIQRATSVEVTSVPTILLVYQDGGVEKYEGNRAFLWAQQIIQQLAPPPQPSPPPPPPVPAPPAPSPKTQDTPEEEDELRQKPEPVKKKTSKPSKKITNIVDLDSESEDDTEIKPPPVGIRQGAGNYELSQSFGQRQEPNRDSSSHTSSGSSDLMAMAQAMQKEREASASKSRRSGEV